MTIIQNAYDHLMDACYAELARDSVNSRSHEEFMAAQAALGMIWQPVMHVNYYDFPYASRGASFQPVREWL